MPIYSCPSCDFKTLNKAHMTKHIGAKHGETTNALVCTECGFRTMYKQNMSRHYKTKHPSVPVEQQAEPPTIDAADEPHPNQSTSFNHYGDNNIVLQINNHYHIHTNGNGPINFPTGDLNTTEVQIIQDEASRKKVLEFIKRRNFVTHKDIVDALMIPYTDLARLPIRKDRSNSGKTHVHKNGQWKTEPDRHVYPKLILQTAADVTTILNDEYTSEEAGHSDPMREKLASNADKMGEFYDRIEGMKITNDGAYVKAKTEGEQRSRLAYKETDHTLKEKAREAFDAYGNPVARNRHLTSS